MCATSTSGTIGVAKSPNPFYITFVPEIPQMSVTLQANYKEIFATETVEKIDELIEDNYALDDILEFVDQNSEADLVAYYEDYCTAGENIGYDVVDAFVKYHGMSYVDNVEEAFRGVYRDEATFAEEYYEDVYGDNIPAFVVVDWEATWNQSLSYDFDFIDGYVFSSNF
jgi:dimeric dUTPase (all-alpha-NTP-PPase superfamily)